MKIICTIGTKTFSPSMIRLLYCAGVDVFRFNLSYANSLDEIAEFIRVVKEETNATVCLDTHGKKHNPENRKWYDLTKFDVKVLKKFGKDNMVAVSFTEHPETVKSAKQHSGTSKGIIAKIESLRGFENREEIIKEANIVLIDRGDLSKTVMAEKTPIYCKRIIETAQKYNKPVWIATNLVESMVKNPEPTLGEIHDIATLIGYGVDGLVLAGETAIGDYPIECVKFIHKMIDMYDGKEAWAKNF